MLQSRRRVQCPAVVAEAGRPDPALGLLHQMPGLVRQVLFLAWGEVDVVALGEGVGIQLRRPVRVAVDPGLVQAQSRQGRDAVHQPLGQGLRRQRVGQRLHRRQVAGLRPCVGQAALGRQLQGGRVLAGQVLYLLSRLAGARCAQLGQTPAG